jgi:hypothetical protein
MKHRAAPLIILVVAVLVLCGVGATSAEAGAEFLTWKTAESEEGFEEEVPISSTVDAAQTASGPLKFTVSSQSVTCTTATASGTLASGASPTLTLTPSYEGCVSTIGGFATDVSVGSCAFVLHLGEELEPGAFKATADLSCGKGSELKFTVTSSPGTKLCTYRVPAQSGLSTVVVSNMAEASPQDITFKNELAGIKVEREGSLLCGPLTNTGQLTGTTTATTTGEGKTVPPIKVAFKKFHFAFEEDELRITQLQDTGQEFIFDAGAVNCPEEVFEGTTFVGALSATSFSLAGRYENCKFKKLGAEIDSSECGYGFTARAIEFGHFLGKTRIFCNPGKSIEVKVAGCTIKIPEQMGPNSEGIGQVVYEDVGTGKGRELTASIYIKELKYEEEEGCSKGAGAKANGVFDGSSFFRASERFGSNQVGLWIGKT